LGFDPPSGVAHSVIGALRRKPLQTPQAFTSSLTKIVPMFAKEAAAIALGVRLITCILAALVVGLTLSAGARAKDTGYVFVSNEKTSNIAVIDPEQNYKIIQWIPTSRRPRDMKFVDDHRLLYVACGDDDVIDVIDVAKLKVTDHIPTGPSPEMFELSRGRKGAIRLERGRLLGAGDQHRR
jgi:YVTN family beta-propeller protein